MFCGVATAFCLVVKTHTTLQLMQLFISHIGLLLGETLHFTETRDTIQTREVVTSVNTTLLYKDVLPDYPWV